MIHFLRSALYALGKLCRQSVLLAGLALLCLVAPLLLGSAVEDSFSRGVEFEGITLALTCGEEDENLHLVRQFLNSMEDMSRYVTFVSMEQSLAMEALEKGEVTAVLHVPWEFVLGIMSGENPDITVYVNEDQPLEGLLLYWVGQSAADMLASVQAGIYNVQDSYAAAPPENLSRSDMIDQINLVYISWTLNRQSLFQTVPLSAAGRLPVELHYRLSILSWLALSLAPVFCVLFDPKRLASRRRLRALGYSEKSCYFSDFAACAALLFALTAAPLSLTEGSSPAGGLFAALVFALLCGSFGCLCCLLTGNSARCGGLSFLICLAALALSGGIVPPVMLPQTLRQLQWLSPVTWLRDVAAAAMGYDCAASSAVCLIVATTAMTALSLLLYRRRMDAGEVAQ